MNKKIYLLAGVFVAVIALAVGAYWYFQKTAVLPESQELGYETESFSQDIAELEEMGQDTALNTLDQDLLAVSEEVSGTAPEASEAAEVDISSVENLESELDAELDAFLNDLTDLEGFESDPSLDNLDNALSSLAE